MKVIVPHHKSQAEAQQVVNKASDDLLAMSGPIDIVDRKKNWRNSTMDFSFTAKYGFVSVPITGTVTVDETNVIVESELPGMVKNFVGEGKVQAGIEKKLNALLA